MTSSFNADPIKSSQPFLINGHRYRVDFMNKDKNPNNFEAIEIVELDKNSKQIGDSYQFTGLNLINESCPVAGMEDAPYVPNKRGIGSDGRRVFTNMVNLKRKGWSEQIDNKELAMYLNNSFATPENNTKFKKTPYAISNNTGYIGKRQKADGTTEEYYTTTLFTPRKKPKENDVIESENQKK